MGCFVPLSEANVAPVCPCVCTEPLSSVRRFIFYHVVQCCSAASPREAHYIKPMNHLRQLCSHVPPAFLMRDYCIS